MSRHPVPYERLIAYASGETAAGEGEAIAAHLATCPDCAATVARFAVARAAVTDAAWAPVPVAAMDRAKGLFAQFGPRPAPPVERTSPLAALRRLVGSVTFDSASGLGLAGARGSGDAYTLVYSSEVAEVDLQVEPAAGADSAGEWQIMGQITPREEPTADGVRVGLATPGDEPPSWVAADAHGYFALRAAPGRYDLLIELPSVLLSLPALDIG